jgi:hypothetical protein
MAKNVKAIAVMIVSMYVIRKQECVLIAKLAGKERDALKVRLINFLWCCLRKNIGLSGVYRLFNIGLDF